MAKLNFSKMVKDTKRFISAKSPEILTGIGIAGMITTTVLAVKATPKALDLIAKAEDAKFDNGHEDPLTTIEKVKVAWKPYIPAAVTGTLSVVCLIGASSVNARRNAALATAYKLSETALTEYKQKVIETVGEKKEKIVREAIDKDKIEKNPVSKSEVIVTKKGETLCYEAISGRYFKSDIDTIEKAVNEINRRLLNDMYISLNELYDEIGLENISLGEDLGWKVEDGLIEIEWSSQIADDGSPCIVMNYLRAPKYGYYRFL